MVDGFLVAVTIFSLSMAAIMAVITWRVIRLDRKQAVAQAEIRPRVTPRIHEPLGVPDAPTWPPVRRDAGTAPWPDVTIERTAPPAPAASPEPDGVDRSGGHGRFPIVVGLGALTLTALLGWGLVFGGLPSTAATVSPAAARVATPLELVALDAARDGDRVTIRGTVRNPAAGTRVEHLEAVFFLFDRRGMYVGTTHTAIAQGVLTPGSESTFEVPLTAGLQVSQYRVSFRMSTAPVPHVDRRPAPAAIITAENRSGGD